MRAAWRRVGSPERIGLAFAFIGALLTVIGLSMGNLTDLTLRSVLLGILLGGGSWGLVSWAIASAASDSMDDGEE